MFFSFFNGVFGKAPVRFIIVGLKNAGKTTMLNKLKALMTPTTDRGLALDSLSYKNITWVSWDLGANNEAIWQDQLQDVRGVVFVIDSADINQASKVKSEFYNLINKAEVANASVLIFINKSDLPNAEYASEWEKRLDIYNFRSHSHYVKEACSTSGDGLYEGWDWLADMVARMRS